MFALVLVPALVVTVMGPVVALEGTAAWICVGAEAFVVVGSTAPLNLTVTGPMKFLPLTVTGVPRAPELGEKSVITGRLPITVNSSVFVPAPKELMTVSGPVVALFGT